MKGQRELAAPVRDREQLDSDLVPLHCLAHGSSRLESQHHVERRPAKQRSVLLKEPLFQFFRQICGCFLHDALRHVMSPRIVGNCRLAVQGNVEALGHFWFSPLRSMQAVESAGLSLAKFKKRAGFASTPWAGPRSPKRDITDALKTVYWARQVSAAFGHEDYKALELRFAAANAGCHDAEPVFTNQWLGYLLGKHVPKTVLPAVEQARPGLNSCLDAPLWPALTARKLSPSQIGKLLQQLAPEIRYVALARPGKAGVREAAMLERRANLDALAAAILLLRSAHTEGRLEGAFEWGRNTWRLMMLLGTELAFAGIARPLAELVEERVMPMATLDGVRYGFPAGSYFKLVGRFAHVVECATELAGRPSTPAKLRSLSRALLDFKSGRHYFWLFNPRRIVAGEAVASQGQQAES